MRTLILSGHGISMRVENAHLMIRDGCEFERPEPATYELKPKYDEYDNIVIYGHSGSITLEAIKWLSKQNIQLTILNWDGSLLTNILIPEPKAGGVRLAQYQAHSGKIRVEVAKKLIDAKIRNSVIVLDWLCERYPELKEEKRTAFDELKHYQSQLPKTTSVAQVRGVEGMVAKDNWSIVSHVIAVLDDLQLNKVHFLGYSMGGGIGFGLACHAPEHFHSFVLGGANAEDDLTDEPNPMLPFFKQGPEAVIGMIEGMSGRPISPTWKNILLGSDYDALSAMLETKEQCGMEAMLPSVEVPALIYIGDEDLGYAGAKRASELMPNATFLLLKGIHTTPYLDQALPHIKEFLNNIV